MFKKYSLLTILALLLPMFWGCTDDIFDQRNPFAGEEEAPGLRISVPHIDATRAGADVPGSTSGVSSDEAKIYSLYLFAYKMKSNGTPDGDPVVYPLVDPSKANSEVTGTVKVSNRNGYDTYEIESFPTGTYKFYIVANVFDSKPSGETYSEIEDLKTVTKSLDVNMMVYPQINTVKGLPMTGDHRDMYTINSNDEEVALPDNGFVYKSGATIYSDLIYCLAKVTVKMEEENGDYLSLDHADLLSYAKSYPLFTTFSSELAISPERQTQLSPKNFDPTDATTKTYTFYVPENTYAGGSPTLTVGTGDVEHTIKLGEKDANRGVYDLKRGHHYDYVLSKRGDITLTVYDWKIDRFSAVINAPFELVLYNGDDFKDGHIVMKISSTDQRRIKYYTDAETLTLVSPQFTYKDVNNKDVTVDFYKWKPDGDEIVVWVNPAVPLSLYNASDEQEKYKYFHIKANNLLKRVEVDIIGIDPVFTVDPVSNIVDLRDILGLGYETVDYTVTYASNFGEVKVTFGDWVDSNDDTLTATEVAKAVSSPISAASASGGHTWTFGNFDKGYTFYQDRRTMKVKYEVVARAGNAEDAELLAALLAGDEASGRPPMPSEYEVTFTVIPYTSNYIIHFKPNTAWSEPHIYAYQCLELPYNLEGTNQSYRGKTVGANKDQAALQYCFSSGFAFRGWTGYGGDINPNIAGGMNNGFFIFGSGAKSFYPYSGAFGASGLTTDTYRWYDFNAAHYKNLKNSKVAQTKCIYDQCNWDEWPTKAESDRTCKLWPGIKMEDEGNGWWRYELSGVAEPGKTLLMFANNHSRGQNDATRERFPADNDPGVPLFDFESKEGWFEYTGTGDQSVNYFRSYNPDGDKTYYRLYYPNNSVGLWLFKKGSTDTSTHLFSGTNDNASGIKTGQDGSYYYKDFSTNMGESEAIQFSIKIGNTNYENKDIPSLKDWKEETFGGSKRYCAYIGSDIKGYAGKPGGQVDPPSGLQYKLYWPNECGGQDMKQIYNKSANSFTNGTLTTVGGKSYYYVELGTTLPTGVFNITTGNNWVVQTNDITFNSSQFNENKEGYLVYVYNNDAKYYNWEIKPEPEDVNDESKWDKKSYRLYVKLHANEDNKVHCGCPVWYSYSDWNGSVVSSANQWFTSGTWQKDGEYYYVDFNQTSMEEWVIKYNLVFGANNVNDWKYETSISRSQFSYDATLNKKVYTITYHSDGHGGKPGSSQARRKTMKVMPKILKRR